MECTSRNSKRCATRFWKQCQALEVAKNGEIALSTGLQLALELNMRPRKRFGFKCPIEQLTKVMLAEHNKPESRH